MLSQVQTNSINNSILWGFSVFVQLVIIIFLAMLLYWDVFTIIENFIKKGETLYAQDISWCSMTQCNIPQDPKT